MNADGTLPEMCDAPVFDTYSQRVVGMFSGYQDRDAYHRSYAVISETILRCCVSGVGTQPRPYLKHTPSISILHLGRKTPPAYQLLATLEILWLFSVSRIQSIVLDEGREKNGPN